MLFFFKQKTAYEVRISDWSSDVCSSDLGAGEAVRAVDVHRARSANALAARAAESERRILIGLDLDQRVEDHRPAIVEINLENVVAGIFARIGIVAVDLETLHARRSEAHTSELQSLMRISYAVF